MKLQKQVPAGVLALLDIQGIGKKASFLWKELKVKNVDDVESCKGGRIARTERFGVKSQEDSLRVVSR